MNNKIPKNYTEYLKKTALLILGVYLVAVAGILPLCYSSENGYATIGEDKALFFFNVVSWTMIFFFLLTVCHIVLKIPKWYKNYQENLFQASIKEIWNRLSATDIFAVIYILSLTVSYFFSDYREQTLWGAAGWYMGFLPQLMLTGTYWIISRILSVKLAKWVEYMMMGVSSIVCLLAVLNRYGVDPLRISSGDPNYISTIGNINWLCGYWSVIFPMGAGLFWLYEKKKPESRHQYSIKWFLFGIVAAIGFVTNITQGSVSGIVAMAGVFLLMGWVAGKDRHQFINFGKMLFIFSIMLILLRIVHIYMPDKNTLPTPVYLWLMETPLLWVIVFIMLAVYLFLQKREWKEKIFIIFKKLWRAMVIFVVAALAIYAGMLIMNTLNPGCLGTLSDHPLFIFDNAWGSARGGTWKAGIRVWMAQDILHKIVGAGPDGMEPYLYLGENVQLLESIYEQFGNIRLTNAHGEWITILVNLGLFGLVGFAGMIISAIIRFLKSNNIWCMVCGMCLFCYTVNNIFSFQQVMNVTQMFIILGVGECLMRKQNNERKVSSKYS